MTTTQADTPWVTPFLAAVGLGAVLIVASAWVVVGFPGINLSAFQRPAVWMSLTVLGAVFMIPLLMFAVAWIAEQLGERVIEIALGVMLGGLMLWFLGIL